MPEELQPTQVQEPEKDPETGKFIYSYQPRDAEGQFLGKPYKFLYTDHQDLVKQLTDAKEHGDRFIHEVKSGKRKLQGVPAEPRPEYKPAPESTEEAEKKERERFRALAEKEFGAPLDDVRERLRKSRESDERSEAMQWAMNKEAEGYYSCPENARKMTAFLVEKNWKMCPENYDKAFEELKDTLVPLPKSEAPADSTQRTEAGGSTPPQRKAQSTGIIPGQFAGTRQANPTEKRPLTRERFRQIDKMSRDEWNRLRRTNPKEAESYLSMKSPAQPQ